MYQNNSFYQSPYSPNLRSSASVPQPPISQAATPFLKGRLVSSIEEARAQTIDFDGSIFYFPDLANQRIYTKQINMDGTSTLNMYELKEIPVANVNNGVDYVTREEFEQAMNPIRQMMAAASSQSPPHPAPKSAEPEPAPYNF